VALERLGAALPLCVSLSLAFLSIALMNEEWYTIREAAAVARSLGRKARAAANRGAAERPDCVGVPAIVLTVKRAWTFTEAAYTRGFDSPHRKPYRQLKMQPTDYALAIGIVGRHRPDFCLALGKRSYHDTLAI